MRIAITDANIFIDLVKLQWLDHLFGIELDIYTTREIIDELNAAQSEKLAKFTEQQLLTIYYFSTDELEAITQLQAPPSLTVQDKSVVFLARQLQAAVLSGDNPLRKFCTTQQLDVKGIIWLFDQFLQHQLVSHNDAVEKMTHLLSFNNRLPLAECNIRLKAWKEIT